MRTITTIRAAIEVASAAVLTEQSSRSAAIVHAVTLLRRHRYLVLRQAGGGAQVRYLFRREAAAGTDRVPRAR